MGADADSKAHPPQVLAQVIVSALNSPSPKANYSVKADPLRAILSYLPTRLVDWILHKVCQK